MMKVRQRFKWKITYKSMGGKCIRRATNQNKRRRNHLWVKPAGEYTFTIVIPAGATITFE